MPKDDFFSVWGEAKMPRQKDPDQVATEKILADEQRENPSPEPPGRQVASLETRDRMRRQKAANELEAAGKSWMCPVCKRVTTNPQDVRDRHCRACEDWQGGGVNVRNPKPRTLA
jgi:hypothetical protein